MAIIVEHEKRKHEILERSLKLFIAMGYDDVTYKKIADCCGLTRTTLYIYYKNKQEIFAQSIKWYTQGLLEAIEVFMEDKSLTNTELLKKTIEYVIDKCQENTELFRVIQSYFIKLQKHETDTMDRVRRRTIRLQHVITNILIRGIDSGEFRPVNLKHTNEILTSIIESSVLRSAVMDSHNMEYSKKVLMNYINDNIIK